MAILKKYREHFPIVGKNVYLAENVVLIGDVVLEDDVNVWWGAVLRGDCGRIYVGKGSNIQDGALLHATTEYSTVELAANVTVGHHAIIHGAKVKEAALVGMKSTLLDNAIIGEYSIVAAGAVVPETMEVPCDTLVAGVPAKIKKNIAIEMRQARLDRALEYRMLAAEYIALQRVLRGDTT